MSDLIFAFKNNSLEYYPYYRLDFTAEVLTGSFVELHNYEFVCFSSNLLVNSRNALF